MRTIVPFNDNWLFLPEDADPKTPDSAFETVTLPHTNKIFPHHNFDNLEYQFISTYRKRFKLPEARNGRRVYVDFDGAMIACEVFLNGQKVGENEGGFNQFSFDLTDYLNETGENLLTVRLDSTERKDIPPYGFVVDYLTFGGIYRDVTLRYVEPVHIQDVFVRTKGVASKKTIVEVDVTFANQGGQVFIGSSPITLHHPKGANLYATLGRLEIPANQTVTVATTIETEKLTDSSQWEYGEEIEEKMLEDWGIENPALYSCEVELCTREELPYRPFAERAKDGNIHNTLDITSVKFGFREAHFDKDGSFYLNGERVKLIGLDRHQTYPYIGGAAPARLQRKDADILKYELGCNIVRTSHYPQSPHFLNRCDEIGLLVLEEIPGWQHIGDRDWQGISLRDVEAMITRDRNHPSIVLWGVRINESPDDTAFYTATNALAHKLDPTRQTGGIRNFQASEFLEDVFTYNDFSNTVLDAVHKPQLITEFNGHMYPTKTWDQEERLIEHALRHARIQDKQLGMPDIAGAIGWCAFDYNTHKEFGSGDRICYHGVSDIFRLPKYAAYFYESQISPDVRPVLRAATIWSMGDRSGGANDPLVIFSNCDEVEVFIGNDLFGRLQPDRVNFPNLPHPPFQATGIQAWQMWGQPMTDLHLVGYVKGEKAAEQWISAHGVPHALEIKVDDTELNADGADMTRLVFRIVDEYGNRMPYATQVISFEIEGPADLIGENPFALVGGQAALYVKARCEAGTVKVRARTMRLELAEATITIR